MPMIEQDGMQEIHKAMLVNSATSNHKNHTKWKME